MTDNGRKRCRKSKLVPRDCAESVEDDSVSQEPAKKKLLLEKIKKEPDDYVPPESSSHEFSVRVEVEDVDVETIPDEGTSSYMQYLFSLSKECPEPQDKEQTTDFEFADNCLLLENKPAFEEENTCYVDVRKVQKMLVSLHKKYPNDREAVMHTRNQWGKAFYERYEFEFRKTTLDDKVQEVLARWLKWTIYSVNRESPFSYKCCICVNAWWSLTEFKTHIARHEHCKLHLETRNKECNIIAYEGNIPTFQDIYVHGKCLKCARTYDHHLMNKILLETNYYCNYCKEKFVTCRTLAKHEGSCNKNPIRVLSISQNGKEYKFSDYSCQVCNTVFLSNIDLTEHLVICHKVRSDEPIAMKLRPCKSCTRKYYTYQLHVCLKKNLVHECKHCNAKFQNKLMLQIHLDMWNKVVRCRICDKYLKRGCMAAEHYALHSPDFLVVHRCLTCRRNMKVFMDEDSMRQHRARDHNRLNTKRPDSDKIIMPKIMLRKCMLDSNARKIIPKILTETHVPSIEPVTSQTDSHPAETQPPAYPSPTIHPVATKMTRGKPMQKVRVCAPVDTKDEELQIKETTISHDDTVKHIEEIPPDNDKVKIKEEKEDETNKNELTYAHTLEKQAGDNDLRIPTEVPENDLRITTEVPENDLRIPTEVPEHDLRITTEVPEHDLRITTEVPDNDLRIPTEVPENEEPEISNKAIKVEKADDVNETPEEDGKQQNESIKNLPQLWEELNEFLDIKPDIVKVKEEKLDDVTIPTVKVENIETESDLSLVLQSSTFAEEVTENSEHSKVFQVSKSILESETIIKQEIKAEPEEKTDDLVIVDSGDELNHESVTSDNSELNILNLEPEVILKAGYRKRKIYRCTRCSFKAYHREYKEHVNNQCMTPKPKPKKDRKEEKVLIFKCTKCGNKFANIKRYVLHFEKHGYHYMSCPQCCNDFDSTTKLISHLNSHIKNQFVRVQVICDTNEKNSKAFKCKTCKNVEDASGFFAHWERHLELMKKPAFEMVEEPGKAGARGGQALEPHVLKRVIELLTQHEKLECKRIKTCNVCDRVFERRNDIKRHYVEHLLEDAYASIDCNNVLKCQMCGALHEKADSYKQHMRDHASLPIYQCSLCNKTFSDSSNFTKHKKIHNLKAYVCDICSKKFQAKMSLQKHIEMHMTTDPIKCDQCERVFHDQSFYRRHYRQFHDKLANRQRCLICKAKFDCLREKWDHMWDVHKQRKHPADCPVCHRSYRKISDVKKHASQEHGVVVAFTNVWKMLHKLGEGGEGGQQTPPVKDDSDDDCLIIEEERETLVVYD